MKKLSAILFLLTSYSCYSQAGGAPAAVVPAAVIAPASTSQEYDAIFLTTNFTVPILRFNILQKSTQTTSAGNVALFNSVGAGLSFNIGRLTVTKDANQNITDQEFVNRIGLQVGFLFSSNSSSGNNANVFAPTLSLTIVNFQIGAGYELGDIAPNQTNFFVSVAYGIPLAKLVSGGYWKIWQSSSQVSLPKNQNMGKAVQFVQ